MSEGTGDAAAVGGDVARMASAVAVAVGEGGASVGRAVAVAVEEGAGRDGRAVDVAVVVGVGEGEGGGRVAVAAALAGDVGRAVETGVGVSIRDRGRGVGGAVGAGIPAVGVARRATTTFGPQETRGARRAARTSAGVFFGVRFTRLLPSRGGEGRQSRRGSYRPGASASASRSLPAGTCRNSVRFPEGQRTVIRSAAPASPRPKKSDFEPEERKE